MWHSPFPFPNVFENGDPKNATKWWEFLQCLCDHIVVIAQLYAHISLIGTMVLE